MALKNLFGKAIMEAPACGSACGAGDKKEEKPETRDANIVTYMRLAAMQNLKK